MAAGLLAARLGLAAVLAVAAAAKLADLRGSREALLGFGVPKRLVASFAVVLPLAELAAAGALLPGASARVGAVATLALFVAFAAAIGVQLARGRTPDCHCFGRLHSSPAGPAALARTLALAGIAAFVAGAGPGPSAVDWLSEPLAAVVAGLALVVVVQACLLLTLLRRHGGLLAKLEQPHASLSVGAYAPSFALEAVMGRKVTFEELRLTGLPLLLVFSDPDCVPCTSLLPTLGQWQADYADHVQIAVISRGDAAVNRAHAEEHAIDNVLLQEDREVAEAYGVYGAPAAVLVVAGRIASDAVYGGEGVHRLLGEALDTAAEEVLVDAR